MKTTARNLMKGALITLLNNSLKARNITHTRVTDLSDDFGTATIEYDGTDTAQVPVDYILPEDSHEEEQESRTCTNRNRGANAAEVNRVRNERIDNVRVQAGGSRLVRGNVRT